MPIFKKEGNQLVEYTQPSQITESLKPLGNTLFADLPASPSQGDMYKVTDDFTTDNRFEESGKEVKAPIFIYFNGTKWVLFASSGGDTHIIGTRNQCISWARQGMIPDGSVCIFTDDYATSTPYVVGTQAQINAMLNQGLLGDGTVCVITDDYTEELNLAENIGYSNTTSGLSADDVQGAIDEVNSNLSGLVQKPFRAYNTAISVGSTATIPYNLSEYREIGLVFQGSNNLAPYWIVMPTTSATLQVGNVVGINSSSKMCGITFGSVTINPSTNSVTNVRMSLLYSANTNWTLSENNRTIAEVWLKK